MKLPDGVTMYIGGRKFKGEIPENMLPVDPVAKKKMVDKMSQKNKAQEKNKSDAGKTADEKIGKTG